MIDQQITEAVKLVQHAAAELIYEDEFGEPMTPTLCDLEMAGVYVQTLLYSVRALASNGISIAHAHLKGDDYDISETFIPMSEEARENKSFHEEFLRFFYSMSETITDTITISKEGLLYLLGGSAFKVISFDEVIHVKVPTKDIINFCKPLPDDAKLELSVIEPREIGIQTALLSLFCQLSDAIYVEQLTKPIEF